MDGLKYGPDKNRTPLVYDNLKMVLPPPLPQENIKYGSSIY
ncbi:MAG: hypothetical protein JWP37_3012 [Mucilaginibacter sp.]|nr:hypothetical protein [Mucilaginibacter sp.]